MTTPQNSFLYLDFSCSDVGRFRTTFILSRVTVSASTRCQQGRRSYLINDLRRVASPTVSRQGRFSCHPSSGSHSKAEGYMDWLVPVKTRIGCADSSLRLMSSKGHLSGDGDYYTATVNSSQAYILPYPATLRNPPKVLLPTHRWRTPLFEDSGDTTRGNGYRSASFSTSAFVFLPLCLIRERSPATYTDNPRVCGQSTLEKFLQPLHDNPF